MAEFFLSEALEKDDRETEVKNRKILRIFLSFSKFIPIFLT